MMTMMSIAAAAITNDMDFETPSFITDALKARLEHSLFGYTMEPEDYLPSIIDWVRDFSYGQRSKCADLLNSY